MDITRMSENKISSPEEFFKSINFGVEDSSRVAEYEKQQEEIKAKEKYEIYKKSGVPEKFFDTTIDDYNAVNEEEIKIKNTAKDFASNPQNRVLICHGKNGNGKSLLGCGIIRVAGGEYVLSSDLCVEYEAATSYHAPRSRIQLLKHYAKLPGVLVIDECCKYTLNPELEKFIDSYIVCARYENNLATDLITNSNKKDFVDFLGKAVFDRFTQVCTSLEFNEPSYRINLRGNV